MKNSRQNEIISIISSETIVTQDELIQKLREKGYKVTQATVSRDIRELRLVKSSDGGGKCRYILPKTNEPGPDDKLSVMLSGIATSVEAAGNLVIIKTKNGMGMAVATGVDSLGFVEIIGTIAGDDTVFVAAKTPAIAERLATRITEFIRL